MRTINGHWTAADIIGVCPECGVNAVVELSKELKALQPDTTTHVCHPSFGGCNTGFDLFKPVFGLKN